jgi:ubiquinone/menaquinone biosynthesis C-methylase UbiE
MQPITFHELSYARHAQGFSSYLVEPKHQKIAASWYDLTSADAWAQERAYEIAHHLGSAPNENWVTIGDGRFGLDSIRLKAHGVNHALATDIDETLLKAAKTGGTLTEYRVENAERLSFQNKSFDYVYCKEALHQCPRPALALYEMLRISMKGVILIEPNDRINSLVRRVRVICKKIMRRPNVNHMDAAAYAESGNYVFSISPREIEKIALALDIPQLAFKGLNDAYEPGHEFEAINSVRGRKMMRKVAFRDMLCRLMLDKPMFLMAAIFHAPVSQEQRKSMEKSGWSFIDLPRNPFIKDHSGPASVT